MKVERERERERERRICNGKNLNARDAVEAGDSGERERERERKEEEEEEAGILELKDDDVRSPPLFSFLLKRRERERERERILVYSTGRHGPSKGADDSDDSLPLRFVGALSSGAAHAGGAGGGR